MLRHAYVDWHNIFPISWTERLLNIQPLHVHVYTHMLTCTRAHTHAHVHTPSAYLSAMGCIIQVFLGVWVWHPGRVTPHNVEVGPGSHSGLGMPLDFSRAWGVRDIGGEEEPHGVRKVMKGRRAKEGRHKYAATLRVTLSYIRTYAHTCTHTHARTHTVQLTGIHHG